MHIFFPTLYRGYWRVVLEVGWPGLLVVDSHGTIFAYD